MPDAPFTGQPHGTGHEPDVLHQMVSRPSPLGPGDWWTGTTATTYVVIVGPGVTASFDEPGHCRNWWRLADWGQQDPGNVAYDEVPTGLRELAIGELRSMLDELWENKLRTACKAQLAQYQSFSASTSGRPDEERARAVAPLEDRLFSELEIAFPEEQWCKRPGESDTTVPDTAGELLLRFDEPAPPTAASSGRAEQGLEHVIAGYWVFVGIIRRLRAAFSALRRAAAPLLSNSPFAAPEHRGADQRPAPDDSSEPSPVSAVNSPE